ncbi:hypothetical protein Q0590_24805 [Rhodocytophaga aerolata]|uniref:Uncharacterized protein n=1 Tax=Rhodocytophaga aerolata TaxID=455078 RepID=A0ABT8RBS5_9BACT|nr:hypothetical protein [Rhodocytophaga aerolata]MDO1449520.1 hypothetical protein [Rhodocytophaga aerolata]
MLNLFSNFTTAGSNPLMGMIKGFVPIATQKLQAKIEEQEVQNGGKLLYMIYNEDVEGKLVTMISIYSFKDSSKGNLKEKINLKSYISNDEILDVVLKNADQALSEFGPLASMIKPHLSSINGEVLGSFLDQITSYLEEQSLLHNGKASIHLQVVKKKPVVQILSHAGGSLQGKPTQVEICTLETFASNLLDQYSF